MRIPSCGVQEEIHLEIQTIVKVLELTKRVHVTFTVVEEKTRSWCDLLRKSLGPR